MVKVMDWDASLFLHDDEDIALYLNAAFEDEDPEMLRMALADAVKARGMAHVAREAGVSRESLYKSLASSGNPSLNTIAKVVHALGARITFEMPAHT